MSMTLKILGFCSTSAFALAGSAAFATASGQAQTSAADPKPAETAESSPTESSDIIVTATRQNASLSKVPVSVAAYSQGAMDSQSVRNIADIARLTPGLRLTPGNDLSGNRTNISIRGISSNVGAATTGIYLDDTPIQSRLVGNVSSNAYPQIFDLERVEVLRGPQGTLFGAGAEGGVVRFISPAPGLEKYSVYARSELASTESGSASYEAGVGAGGPIVAGKLGFRASAYYRRDGGYVDRVDRTSGQMVEKDANSIDTWTVRGALKWKPIDTLDITLSAYHQDRKKKGTDLAFESLSNLNGGVLRSGKVLPQPSRDTFTIPTLNMEFDAGFAKLISTTSNFTRKATMTVDYTNFIGAVLLGGPFAFNPGETSSAVFTDRQKSFTQEIRLQSNANGSPFSWTIGGFYNRAIQSSLQVNDDPFLDAASVRITGRNVQQRLGYALIDGRYSFINDQSIIDKQTAVFGQADYEVFDGFKVTGGLRWADVKVQYDRSTRGPVGGAPVSLSGRQSERPVTPKFGISWQVDRDNLLYASAAKGYRVGGINGPQIALCTPFFSQLGITSPETYKSDSVWSYEGGAKTRLFGGAVRADISAFRIYWRDIQRQIRISQCGSSFTTNLGKATSTGFDLSLDIRPVAGLALGTSVGYADAKLTQSALGVPTNGITPVFAQAGDKIGGAPWNYTFSGEYEFAVGNDRQAYLRGDFQHTNRGVDYNYTVVGADRTIPPSEAFDNLSLRAGVRFSKLDVSVFVNNALDQAPLISRTHDSGASPLYYNLSIRPRTFGLTTSFRY